MTKADLKQKMTELGTIFQFGVDLLENCTARIVGSAGLLTSLS